jgi:hypothetical protein
MANMIWKKVLLPLPFAIFVILQITLESHIKSELVMAEKLREAKAKAGLISRRADPDANRGIIPDGVDSFCVLWDEQLIDIDIWWTHHPEYVADEQNTTHQCFRKEKSPEKLQLFQRIYNNQFRSGCENPLKRPLRSAGWGSDFNGLGEGLLEALSLQKAMLVVPAPWFPKGRGWLYSVKEDGSAATCSFKDFQCYFLPTISSACMNGQSFLDLDTAGFDDNPYGIYHYNSSFAWAYQYLARGHSWLRRELVHFVEKERPRFPPNESCTVIHVRRGDLILEDENQYARGYHAISEYLDLLPKERRQAGSNFFLLTDDANVIDEARLLHSDLNWHWINRARNKGSQMEYGKHLIAATPKDDVVVILGTFELIKRCNAIVTGRSCFAGLLRDQIVDAWQEEGQDVFLALLEENFTSDEERRRSGQSIAEKLEAAKAKAKRGLLRR